MNMAGMSQITALGNLGRDAQLRETPDGKSVCSFSVCANVRKGRDDTPVWFNCTLWGKRAEALGPHLTKGTMVCITGQLVPREYKGKNDELRQSLDVDVREIAFAGGRSEQPAADHPPTRQQQSAPVVDDDIPF